MSRRLSMVAVVVRDYDEAIRYYTGVLGLRLVEDSDLGNGKRWVVVSAEGSDGVRLLLARAATTEQESRVGNQTGGRVFLFYETDDFWRDYHDFCARGVRFLEEPRAESYATVAVFEDLYGNKWDFLERRPPR